MLWQSSWTEPAFRVSISPGWYYLPDDSEQAALLQGAVGLCVPITSAFSLHGDFLLAVGLHDYMDGVSNFLMTSLRFAFTLR